MVNNLFTFVQPIILIYLFFVCILIINHMNYCNLKYLYGFVHMLLICWINCNIECYPEKLSLDHHARYAMTNLSMYDSTNRT